MFFLLYKHTDDGVFGYFPKIFQNYSEDRTNLSGHFPNISEHFSKIDEDDREDPNMFRSYTNNFKCGKGDKRRLPSKMISHVRISYRVYQFVATRYTADFNIIIGYIIKLSNGSLR